MRDIPTAPDPIFGVQVPQAVSDVPAAVLNPRSACPDPDEYDGAARQLKAMFDRQIGRIGKAASAG